MADEESDTNLSLNLINGAKTLFSRLKTLPLVFYNQMGKQFHLSVVYRPPGPYLDVSFSKC